MKYIFKMIEIAKNALSKILSFGQLPDNVPELVISGYMYEPDTKEFVLTVAVRSHSVVISKIKSWDYEPLKQSLRVNKRILSGIMEDILLSTSNHFEFVEKFHLDVYFQDIQNRRYIAELLISPKDNTFDLLGVRRTFGK